MKKDEYFFTYPDFNNIREIILDAINKFPKNRAFILKDKEGNHHNKTFEEFFVDIKNLSTGLFNLGLKNKRIAIVGANSYMWALSYVSILMGNMVAVPLDKGLEEGELEDSLIRSEADAIIFDEKHLEVINKIKENGKTNLKFYITNGEADEFINFESLKNDGAKLLEEGNKEFDNVEVDSDKLSVLLFTSGTTSKSKAVMLSQRNIASNIVSMHATEDFRETDVNLAFLPFHHTFGSTGLLVLLSSGAASAFPDGLR